MKMYYVTVNNEDEAKTISSSLLENHLVVCTNWWPIACCYRWQGEIKTDKEYVLIIKTKDGLKEQITSAISKIINYTNFIAEIEPTAVNLPFLNWLETEVK